MMMKRQARKRLKELCCKLRMVGGGWKETETKDGGSSERSEEQGASEPA